MSEWSIESRLSSLQHHIDKLYDITREQAKQNKELREENRKLGEPLRKLKAESMAMRAKANNAKKLVKTLQEVNEINSTDT